MSATEELEAVLDDIVKRDRESLHRLFRADFEVYRAGAAALQEAQRGRARHRPSATFEKWIHDLVIGNLGR